MCSHAEGRDIRGAFIIDCSNVADLTAQATQATLAVLLIDAGLVSAATASRPLLVWQR
jgi:hypothetical protein